MKVTIQDTQETTALPPLTWHGGTSLFLSNGTPYCLGNEREVDELKAGKTRIGRNVIALGKYPCFAIPSDSDAVTESHEPILSQLPLVAASHPRGNEQVVVAHRYAPDVSFGLMISGFATSNSFRAQRDRETAMENAKLGIGAGLVKRTKPDGTTSDIGLTSVIVMLYGVRSPTQPFDYTEAWRVYGSDLIDPTTPSHALFRLTMRSYNSNTLYSACMAVSLMAHGINLLRNHPKYSKRFIDLTLQYAEGMEAYNGRYDDLRAVLEGREDVGPPSIALTYAGPFSISPKNVSTIIPAPMFAIGSLFITGSNDSIEPWKSVTSVLSRLNRRPNDSVDDAFLETFADAAAQALYPAVLMPGFFELPDPLEKIVDLQTTYTERMFVESHAETEAGTHTDETDHSTDQF